MMSLFSFLAAEVCALTSAKWMMAAFIPVREINISNYVVSKKKAIYSQTVPTKFIHEVIGVMSICGVTLRSA